MVGGKGEGRFHAQIVRALHIFSWPGGERPGWQKHHKNYMVSLGNRPDERLIMQK